MSEENNILIYQDECGIQKDLIREKGWELGNQKLYGNTTGTKHKKTGIISGYTKLPDKQNYLYIAPFVYDGYCDTILFNHWLERVFIPEINKLKEIYPDNPITIILDNVAYHKSDTTKELLKQHNINLLFQPPYSPDLNKIEPSWTHTKNRVRKQDKDKDKQKTFQEKLFKAILEVCW